MIRKTQHLDFTALLIMAGHPYADVTNLTEEQPTIAPAISASVNGDIPRI